ncbi:hypothetical protein POM88_023653 [Heracleum sosnowskyi]|uniref:Uncharacterized protein n=1 Tax=Heracleum sosnowskyi TaxID=360622 RepID=A0AAD8IJX3_9APIA|nr:hypothetical protein POM88_023653 [Heracleum sosnowskyi]
MWKLINLSLLLMVLSFSGFGEATSRPNPYFPTIPNIPFVTSLPPSISQVPGLPTIPTPLFPGSLSPINSPIPGLPGLNPPVTSIPGFPTFYGPPQAPPSD